jgi:drug/metabolite transporter (DMT)-like permease
MSVPPACSATMPPHRPIADPPPPSAAWATPAVQGWLLGLLGVLVFALTIPMTRLASGSLEAPQLPAAFVAMGRAALAGVLAAAWLLARRAPWPSTRQWRDLGFTACGVVFGFPLCLGWAVQRVEAAHAAVVTGLLPLATAVIASLLMRQRASMAFWACAVAGTGVVLAYAVARSGGALQVGDAWLLAAVLLGGFGYVMGARLSVPGAANGQASGQASGSALAPEAVISWVLVGCLPLTLPLSWLLAPADWGAVRPAAWGGFLYVALASQWLGFFAWYRGLALGGMLRVSQVQLLQPFLAMLLAVPVLGEPLDGLAVLCGLAVMVLVFMARRTAPR